MPAQTSLGPRVQFTQFLKTKITIKSYCGMFDTIKQTTMTNTINEDLEFLHLIAKG